MMAWRQRVAMITKPRMFVPVSPLSVEYTKIAVAKITAIPQTAVIFLSLPGIYGPRFSISISDNLIMGGFHN
jgi:hypothetical protein